MAEPPYYEISVEDGIVRVRRTARAFDSADVARAQYQALIARLRSLAPRRLLSDLRGAPPARNDPEFERAGDELRSGIKALGARTAFLVRSAVGVLQVNRLAREIGAEVHVFRDEREALAYLREK